MRRRPPDDGGGRAWLFQGLAETARGRTWARCQRRWFLRSSRAGGPERRTSPSSTSPGRCDPRGKGARQSPTTPLGRQTPEGEPRPRAGPSRTAHGCGARWRVGWRLQAARRNRVRDVMPAAISTKDRHARRRARLAGRGSRRSLQLVGAPRSRPVGRENPSAAASPGLTPGNAVCPSSDAAVEAAGRAHPRRAARCVGSCRSATGLDDNGRHAGAVGILKTRRAPLPEAGVDKTRIATERESEGARLSSARPGLEPPMASSVGPVCAHSLLPSTASGCSRAGSSAAPGPGRTRTMCWRGIPPGDQGRVASKTPPHPRTRW